MSNIKSNSQTIYIETLEKEIPNLKINVFDTNQYGYSHVLYTIGDKTVYLAGVRFDRPLNVEQEKRSILSSFNQL